MVKISDDSKKNNRKRINRTRSMCKVLVLVFFSVSIIAQYARVNFSYLNSNSQSFTTTTQKDHQLPSVHKSFPKTENPGSQSIFNCNGESGKCKYFYPLQFFSETSEDETGNELPAGDGVKYAYMYEHMRNLKEEGKLWVNMPRIVLLKLRLDEEKDQPPLDTSNTKPIIHSRNVTFIHNHKVGGTSIHYQSRTKNWKPDPITLFHWSNSVRDQSQRQSVSQSAGEKAKQFTSVPMKRRSLAAPKDDRMNKQNMKAALMNRRKSKRVDFDRAVRHIQSASKYKYPQSEWNENEHLFFGFIRNPLDRFISSIGQAMGARGSQSNKVSGILKKQCVHGDGETYTLEKSQYLLQCCLNYVKEHGFEVEIHFNPQVLEFSFATQMYPVPVAIFQYEQDYSNVMVEMGMDPSYRQRDGGSVRPVPFLKDVTSADYTEDMRRQVCELYEVDVVMFRSLGWTTPCDEYF